MQRLVGCLFYCSFVFAVVGSTLALADASYIVAKNDESRTLYWAVAGETSTTLYAVTLEPDELVDGHLPPWLKEKAMYLVRVSNYGFEIHPSGFGFQCGRSNPLCNQVHSFDVLGVVRKQGECNGNWRSDGSGFRCITGEVNWQDLPYWDQAFSELSKRDQLVFFGRALGHTFSWDLTQEPIASNWKDADLIGNFTGIQDEDVPVAFARLAAEVDSLPEVPAIATQHYLKGNDLFQDTHSSKDLGHAAVEYEKAITLAPWFRDAYFNLAHVHELLGNYKVAAQIYNICLRFDPSTQDAKTVSNKIESLQSQARSAESRYNYNKQHPN